MNGVMIAPHGTIDGLIGLSTSTVSSNFTKNYIAFEYCVPCHDWWYDIVDGCQI